MAVARRECHGVGACLSAHIITAVSFPQNHSSCSVGAIGGGSGLCIPPTSAFPLQSHPGGYLASILGLEIQHFHVTSLANLKYKITDNKS